MTNFKAGDKVVCVDASPGLNPRACGFHDNLVRGAIYLVGRIYEHEGIVYLVLSPDDLNEERNLGWRASRFRKLITATERAQMEREKAAPLTYNRAVELGLLLPVKPVSTKLK